MNKMTRKLTYLILVMISCTLAAQEKLPEKPSSLALQDSQDSIGTADYLTALQRVGEMIESARGEVNPGLEVVGAINAIKKIQQDLFLVNINLAGNTSGNIRNLKMYRNVMDEIKTGLAHQDSILRKERKRLGNLKSGLNSIATDTIINKIRRDKELQQQFAGQIAILQAQWKATDSLLLHYHNQTNDYLTTSAQNKIALDKTYSEIATRMEKSSISQEYKPIWQVKNATPLSAQQAKSRMMGETMAFIYYMKYRLGDALFILLLVFGGGYWIRYLKRQLSGEKEAVLLTVNNLYVRNLPACGAVLATTLLVFINLDAPASVAALLFIIQTVTAGFVVYRHWEPNAFRIWLTICLLFTIALLLDLFIEISLVQRLLFMAINITAILYRKKLSEQLLSHTTGEIALKAGRFLIFWLNVFALLSNILGSVTVSQTLTLAGFIFVAEWFALSLCITIITESLCLQVAALRVRKGIYSPFDRQQLLSGIRKPFILLQGWLLVIILTVSLNAWDGVKELTNAAYHHKATIGDLTISIGNVMMFVLVVWLAHILQRFVGFFFGDTGLPEDGGDKKQHSKMLITRLIVLITGYFIAVLASGVPLDKISIAIGALGVGVGLGLQNVVNNFVSGVILIFDRPIQVGDMIDFGGREGRVKSIDLRTTKLDINNGAEVIIPNGNLLSQNITNWTYSSYNRMASLSLGLTGDVSREEIISIATQALAGVPGVIEEQQNVLFTAVNSGSFEITIQFWCSIYRLEQTLSETRLALYNAFSQKDIALTWK